VRALRSGWLPAALVLAFAAILVRLGAGVGWGDQVRFAGYVLGWLVVPGTLIWRAVQGADRVRPLVEDLTVGMLVGYVAEFPVYMLSVASGHPKAYVTWPLVVAVATLSHQRGRALWTRPVTAVPTWWSWTTAGLLAYVVAWFGHAWWGPSPVTAAGLRAPYVDEPYHLSVVAELRHHFPPEVPYVAGLDLNYHFLSHLHVAAASWVTGTEPIVLLRSLALPTLFVVCALAAACIAVRMTGAAWTGPATVVAMLLAPADFSGWVPGASEGLLETRLIRSPSAGFVNAALLLGVLLCLELLRRGLRGWPVWALTGTTFVAMAGSKSTSLPAIGAGLVAATAICSLVDRRWHRNAALLSGLAAAAFLVAYAIFFAGGAEGLRFQPLAMLSAKDAARFLGLVDGNGMMPMSASIVAATSLIGMLALGAPLLGLLARGGWRRPEAVFLVVTCAAGVGAGLTFHGTDFDEIYFVYVILLPLSLGAVLGLFRLGGGLSGMSQRVLALGGLTVFAGAVLAVGVLGALAHPQVDPQKPARLTESPVRAAIDVFLIPAGAVLALALVLTAVFVVGFGRFAERRAVLVLPIAAVVFAGLGSVRAVQGPSYGPGAVSLFPGLFADPIPALLPRSELIGPGGLEAARWLREHAAVTDLIATNAHCRAPTGSQVECDARNFWIAGYSERRVLVEGWSYVMNSRALYAGIVTGRFWDPPKQRANDAAFYRPTEQRVQKLRRTYGVRWLFVDRRFPADVAGLKEVGRVAFERGDYIVLSI
jgi:hypothetical protein